MKQKKLFFLFALFLISISTVLAQVKEITGTVTDNSGIPLPGVNVLVKGTSNGTQTDFDGNFSISASKGEVLVFSYVGLATVEETVGDSNTMTVQMVEDLVNLNEVVVTSLGITREKRSLGYAVTELKAEEINTVKDHNIANSLVGKVAGVTINQSGGLGSASRIVIRGNNSITGRNQAFIVVDGVPISARGEDSGGSVYSSSVVGGGITDINPEDVESISVLKGPNAAALYGADAARGVVLITTKKGRLSRGLGVSVTSNTTFERPMFLPDYQNEYGQGNNSDLSVAGDATNYSLPGGSWGPRLDGSSKPYFTAFDATRPYSAQPDNIKDFFDTGVKTINSVAIDKGGEGFGARFSYTNNYTSSIMPGSALENHSFNLRTVMDLSDKMSFDAKATYFTQALDGRVNLGSEGVLNYVYNIPRNVDVNDLKNFRFGELGRLSYTGPNSNLGNPYAILEHDINDERRNRFIGFAKVDYEFTDWLSAFVRIGSDVTNIRTNRIDQVGHHFYPTGRIALETIKNTQFNADFLVTVNKDITETLNLVASVGGNLKKGSTESVSLDGSNFRIPTRPFYENSVIQEASYEPMQIRKVNSLYATVSLAYDDFMYLDLTGRNDWSSTLSKDNRSYFYPSVSYSLLIDKFIDPDREVVDMLKLRASWAKVGNDTGPYQLASTFNVAGTGYLGLTILSPPDIIYNPDLKSESIESYEFGFETKFFKNRLYGEFSYYNIKTTDMIFQIPTPSGVLFNTNIGEVSNKGVEFLVGGIPVMNNDFRWDVSLNFSKNKNEVGELTEGIEEFGFNVSNSGNVKTVARAGGAIGDIYGTTWSRDTSGNLLVLADGTPKTSGNSDQNYLGNANPDWLAGLTNTISYKNFSLRFLIDGRFGGEIFSATSAGLDNNGTSERTLQYREGGIVIDAINEGTGSANTENITAQEYWGALSGIAENYIYDQTNIRLREFVLNYAVPKNIVEHIGANSATIGLIGRNLFFLYKKADDIDPEGTLGTSLNGQGLSSNNVPAIRSIGLNVNLKF